MDSSDITKRRKNLAHYLDKVNQFARNNPAGDCTSLATCCTVPSNCVRTFDSYDSKYTFYKGRNACVTGSGPIGDFAFGVKGCLYPANGGSK